MIIQTETNTTISICFLFDQLLYTLSLACVTDGLLYFLTLVLHEIKVKMLKF